MLSVNQHWDPLKVCAVGRSYPPEFYSHIENPRVRNVMERIAIETEEDYQKLISKLEEFGVTVLRTDLSDIKEDYILESNTYFPPPMAPRDHTAMIGDTFYMPGREIELNIQLDKMVMDIKNKIISGEGLENEEKYLADILLPGRGLSKQYITSGKLSIKNNALKVMLATDDNIKNLIYMSETNTIGSTRKFVNNNKTYAFNTIENFLTENKVPIKYNTFINTATTLRIGKDLYFNAVNLIGKLNKERYISNLKKLFPEYRINMLAVPGHADGCLSAVKPGLLVGLQDTIDYMGSFPDWEVVSIPGESWNKLKPFLDVKKHNKGKWWIKGEEYNQDLIDYIETWMSDWVTYVEETVFDVNMLVIDEHNVICNGYNEKVFKAFEKHNITPHIINFRHRYFWDSGLHCITSDISREGDRKDYFPERGDTDRVIYHVT